MNQLFFIVLFSLSVYYSQAQSVGINATGDAPHASALLHVDAATDTAKGLLITGTQQANATVPNLGSGSRLLFYPGKAALRAGSVSGNQWDNTNVGLNSVALGQNTLASGVASTAIGNGASASGNSSLGLGYFVNASGFSSVAMGGFAEASGSLATSIGTASNASGLYSVAIGYNASATGISAMSLGTGTAATGANSTALGYGSSTDGHSGSFAIGDASGTFVKNSTTNQMIMHFANGYVLKGGNVQVDARLTADGAITAKGGVLLPTAGGTAAELNHYEETTASVNFTNGANSYLSNYGLKILRVGKQVTLTLPTDQTGLTVNGVGDMIVSSIPARFRPSTNIYLPLRIRNNGTDGMGLLWIQTNGQAWLKPSASGGLWSGNGNAGFYATSLTYSVQ